MLDDKWARAPQLLGSSSPLLHTTNHHRLSGLRSSPFIILWFPGTAVWTSAFLFRIPQHCRQGVGRAALSPGSQLGGWGWNLLLSSDCWQDLCLCGYITGDSCCLLAGGHPNGCQHFPATWLSAQAFPNMASCFFKANRRIPLSIQCPSPIFLYNEM